MKYDEIRILVKVYAGVSRDEVVSTDNPMRYIVYTQAMPSNNRANKRVTELLAEYFCTEKEKVTLVRGSQSPSKHFIVRTHSSESCA